MKTILVVDPDEAVGTLLADILRTEGYEVRLAHNLQETIEMLRQTHFDLLITEAFGQEALFDFDPAFLTELRQHANGTPIVLCSTYPSTDTLHAGDFGLADIVLKPFEVDDLLKKANRLLS